MSKLRSIAQAMRQGLDGSKQAGKEKDWDLRRLARGLEVLLSFQDNRWRLALRRTDVTPSDEEVAVLAEAFDVPPGCARRRYSVAEKNSITHHKRVYFIVEMTWREVDGHPAARPAALSRRMATGTPSEGPDHVALAPRAPGQ